MTLIESLFFSLAFSFLFLNITSAYADITLKEITVNLDTVNWDFPNPTTLTNFTIQDDGLTMRLSDSSENRKYNFFRAGSAVPYDITLTSFSSQKADFTIDTPTLTDVRLTVTGTQLEGVTLNGATAGFTWNGVSNTINVNAASTVSVFFTNPPNTGGGSGGTSGSAPTVTVSKSSSSFANQPIPEKIKKIIQQSKPLQPMKTILQGEFPSFKFPFCINDMCFPLADFSNTIETVTLLTHEPVTIKSVFSQTSKFAHIAVYTNLTDGKISQSDTFIIYEPGNLKVVDPYGFFEKLGVNVLENGSIKEAIFEISFAKPMMQSDIILRNWDEKRRSSDLIIRDAIKVVESDSKSNILAEQKQEQYDLTEIIQTPDLGVTHEKLMEWAGYNTNVVSDKEILEEMGISGKKIPEWTKSQFGKWLYQNKITLKEFENAINYLYSQGIIY